MGRRKENCRKDEGKEERREEEKDKIGYMWVKEIRRRLY